MLELAESDTILNNQIQVNISALQQKLNIQYDNIQARGIQQAVSSKVMILTGGSGTGKTTTTLGIIEALKSLDNKILLGGNTVIMSDECLQEFLCSWVKDVEGYKLFDFENLVKLNEELKKYGYQMNSTHHMFLPCHDVNVEKHYPVKWFYGNEINQFYSDLRFPNAIAFPVSCPVRPDRIVVIAVDGDTIMGMAGCSEDAPHWQQIGIDVLPEYRSRGIGTYLVSLLKNKIIETGDIPFYGTAATNIHSQNIAINCGFRPVWVETEAIKLEEEN